MSTTAAPPDAEFSWTTQPAAARLIAELVAGIENDSPATQQLRERLVIETGTRLDDWIDHLVLPESDAVLARLAEAGFTIDESPDRQVWRCGAMPASGGGSCSR